MDIGRVVEKGGWWSREDGGEGRVVEKEREVHDTVTTPVSVSHEGWCAIKDNDTVCEVGGHDEIVFHYKGRLLGM